MNKMNFRLIIVGFLMSLLLSCNKGRNEGLVDSKISLEKTLANYYPKQGKENNLRAIETIEELIRIDSTNGKYIFARGYCYGQLGLYEQANEELTKAKNLGFDQKLCLTNIIINLSEIGDFNKIKSYLKELKLIDSDKMHMDTFVRYLQLKQEHARLKEESVQFKKKSSLKNGNI